MSFQFVLSYIDIDDDSPIELIEKHFLRKANAEELVLIKKQLFLLKDFFPHLKNYTNIYEQNIIREDDEADGRFENQQSGNWKYYVIDYSTFDRSNQEMYLLEKALILLKNSIYLGFSFVTDDKLFMFSADWTSLYLELENPFSLPYLQKYCIDDFNEIVNIHKQIYKIEEDENIYLFIKKALEDFYRIQRLGRLTLNENIKILGYFSIIEMLIAHKPKLKESIDSISHQINTKYNLLFKKFKREVTFSDYFLSDIKNETVWKKLYAYRSDLAHGNIVDFSKDYKILDKYNNKGHDIYKNPSICINNFLEEVIKNTILIALDKPEFIFDLKQC
jgi:hypothetical protein